MANTNWLVEKKKRHALESDLNALEAHLQAVQSAPTDLSEPSENEAAETEEDAWIHAQEKLEVEQKRHDEEAKEVLEYFCFITV